MSKKTKTSGSDPGRSGKSRGGSFPSRKLSELLVRGEDSLFTAMRVIDAGRIKLAFVEGTDGKIAGTLSDGDVRRALLRGARIDAPSGVNRAMNRAFKSVGPELGRPEVLDLMRAFHVNQLPVIDRAGKMIGVHLLEELLGAVPRPNRAVIMAGGRGIRLRPLTENVPKPMLPVAGRPILERLVLHLVGYGVSDVFISVNYLGEVIEKHFGDGSAFGCRIRYLREKKALGTGGPLSLLPRDSEHPVLVLNGDLVTQVRIDELLDFHDKGGFTGTLCVRPHQIEIPFGVADVDGDRLVRLREKPTDEVLVNAGIYVLSPEALGLVPKNEEYPITQLFEDCLAKKRPVGVHVLRSDWVDVGRHDELRRARGEA